MIVTAEQLRSLGACEGQVELFESLFGEQVEVTETLCLEFFDKFNWDWAARHLLPGYAAWAEYEHEAAVEHNRAVAPARAEYERIRRVTWAESKRAEDAALAEYKRTEKSARAKYRRAIASAFGRLAERL